MIEQTIQVTRFTFEEGTLWSSNWCAAESQEIFLFVCFLNKGLGTPELGSPGWAQAFGTDFNKLSDLSDAHNVTSTRSAGSALLRCIGGHSVHIPQLQLPGPCCDFPRTGQTLVCPMIKGRSSSMLCPGGPWPEDALGSRARWDSNGCLAPGRNTYSVATWQPGNCCFLSQGSTC